MPSDRLTTRSGRLWCDLTRRPHQPRDRTVGAATGRTVSRGAPSDVCERGCTHPGFSERPATSRGNARASPGVLPWGGRRQPAGNINVAEHASVSRSGAQPMAPRQLRSPCVPGNAAAPPESLSRLVLGDKRGHEVLSPHVFGSQVFEVLGSQVFDVAPALVAGESRLAADGRTAATRSCSGDGEPRERVDAGPPGGPVPRLCRRGKRRAGVQPQPGDPGWLTR
jgi:hypothetical protein